MAFPLLWNCHKGCCVYNLPRYETRLVPFLHNGRFPKTGAVCPPEIQLVLVTKGIMDVQFHRGVAQKPERTVWDREAGVAGSPSPTNLLTVGKKSKLPPRERVAKRTLNCSKTIRQLWWWKSTRSTHLWEHETELERNLRQVDG